MKQRLLAVLTIVAQAAIAVPAAWQAAVLGWIFVSRASYPMDIEWMEGGALYHAYRLAHHQPIYGPPSQGFLPFPYPPLHYAAIAIAGLPFGIDYAVGRGVSIAFFALTCGLLAREVALAAGGARRGAAFGALAVGAIVVGFPFVGGWYDLIRNDSLALALPVLGASVAGASSVSKRRAAVAAGIFALSLIAKQTNVFFAAWVGLYLLIFDRRAGLVFGACFAGGAAALLGAIQLATHGWMWTYTVTNLSKHVVRVKQAWVGLTQVQDYAPFAVALPVAVLAVLVFARPGKRTLLWIGMLAAALPASLLPFAKAGGFLNNLVPLVVLVGPVTLIVASDLTKLAARRPKLHAALGFVLLAGASAFVVSRRIDAKRFVPDAALRKKAAQLNTFIAELDGDVLVPNHPFLPIRNGKTNTPQIHEMSYEDAIGGNLKGMALSAWLRQTGARFLLLAPLQNYSFAGWVYKVYAPSRRVPVRISTTTGFRTGPSEVLEIRPPPIRRSNVRVLFDFEQATWEGWEVTGDAFGTGPERHVPGQTWIEGRAGKKLADSFHPPRYDEATGEALSPEFVIDRRYMGLLVGGGMRPRARVELRIDGRPMVFATGVNAEVLIDVEWDLEKYKGQTARLAIVDDDDQGWGHVIVDQVELFDVAP